MFDKIVKSSSWGKKSFSKITSILVGNLIVVTSIYAQEPTKETEPKALPLSINRTTQQNLFAVPKSVEIPENRLGIDKNKVLRLSLSETVKMMLTQNLELKDFQENISIAEHELNASQGVYDVVTNVDFNFAHDTIPSTSMLYINNNPNPLKVFKLITDAYTYNYNVSQPYASGGFLNIGFLNTRTDSNQRDLKISTAYRSKTVVSFSQPLLKNFRINKNSSQVLTLSKKTGTSDLKLGFVKISKIDTGKKDGQAELKLRRKLIDLVAATQAAYYELVFSIKNQEILKESVELANAQLKVNQSRVNLEKAAPYEIVSSRSEIELRQGALLSSMLDITKTENELKTLISNGTDNEIWQTQISPIEPIVFSPKEINLDELLDTALKNRPEIKELELDQELNGLENAFYKNQKKVELNIFGTLLTQYIMGRENALPQIRNLPLPRGIPPNFKGNFFEGLGSIFKLRNYRIGADYNFLKGGKEAKENLLRLGEENKKINLRVQQVIQTITSEVNIAAQALKAAEERVKVLSIVIKGAEAELRAEQQRYELDRSTNIKVLEKQNFLSLTRGRELRAKIDYIKALAELDRVTANSF